MICSLKIKNLSGEKAERGLNREVFSRVAICVTAMFTLLLVSIGGCTDCEPLPPIDTSSGDIIFVGEALNSEMPSVFVVAEDGEGLSELIKEAVIYSSKTNNEILTYLDLSDIESGNVLLRSYDLNSGESQPLREPDEKDNVNYPVVSQDGRYYAFVRHGQIVVGDGSGNWNSEFYNICPNALPTFSPSGDYIAFFVGDSLEAPLRITAVSSANPGNEVYFKELVFGIDGLKGEAELDWSSPDFIVYAVQIDEDSSEIGLWNIKDDSESYKIGVRGLGMYNPKLSPDGKQIAFTDAKGDLWIRNAKDNPENPGWEAVTAVEEYEYVRYPRWSKDGNKIIFVKDYIGGGVCDGALQIVELDDLETKIVANNVYRAFWHNDQ